MILSGSNSQLLGARLANELNTNLASVQYETFPDGEQKVSVPETVNESVIIVSSTVTDSAHIELLQLQDAARESGATHITTILPYMGYARQDKVFESGDPVSARAVARSISIEADEVITINPHEPSVTEFFTVPAETIDISAQLAQPLPNGLQDPVFVAPDEGALSIARQIQEAYGSGNIDHMEKNRISSTQVEISSPSTDVTDQDVVITDDIIATGSTMSEAIRVLQNEGPHRVFITCIHPLFVQNAYTKLQTAGVEAIYATDTIERGVSSVSVATPLSNAVNL
ncbi:MAG: ribose-phosphate diphosphokinase [Halobacteriaceae archaeon]